MIGIRKISTVLWEYLTTCKMLKGQTAYRLVYGQEVVLPMENIVPCLQIVVITKMTNVGTVEERLLQLV